MRLRLPSYAEESLLWLGEGALFRDREAAYPTERTRRVVPADSCRIEE